MYLTMRVKVGGMTDHLIVVDVALAADHGEAHGDRASSVSSVIAAPHPVEANARRPATASSAAEA